MVGVVEMQINRLSCVTSSLYYKSRILQDWGLRVTLFRRGRRSPRLIKSYQNLCSPYARNTAHRRWLQIHQTSFQPATSISSHLNRPWARSMARPSASLHRTRRIRIHRDLDEKWFFADQYHICESLAGKFHSSLSIIITRQRGNVASQFRTLYAQLTTQLVSKSKPLHVCIGGIGHSAGVLAAFACRYSLRYIP